MMFHEINHLVFTNSYFYLTEDLANGETIWSIDKTGTYLGNICLINISTQKVYACYASTVSNGVSGIIIPEGAVPAGYYVAVGLFSIT